MPQTAPLAVRRQCTIAKHKKQDSAVQYNRWSTLKSNFGCLSGSFGNVDSPFSIMDYTLPASAAGWLCRKIWSSMFQTTKQDTIDDNIRQIPRTFSLPLAHYLRAPLSQLPLLRTSEAVRNFAKRKRFFSLHYLVSPVFGDSSGCVVFHRNEKKRGSAPSVVLCADNGWRYRNYATCLSIDRENPSIVKRVSKIAHCCLTAVTNAWFAYLSRIIVQTRFVGPQPLDCVCMYYFSKERERLQLMTLFQ